MKGLFNWLKSNTKIKRWLFLILIGIIFFCNAISNIIVEKEREFQDLIFIAISFVIGFLCTIIGIIHIQRRTLEILVENTNLNNSENVKSLIYNKKVYNQGPKIVVLGGGNGLNSILKGLKNYTDNITAIVTVSDYEKGTLKSSNTQKSMPLDEVKGSIISLAKDENLMSDLINLKFNDTKLKDFSFGDIFLHAMDEINVDISESIEKTKDILNMTGKVLPVTLENIKICAELEDGTVIENKDEIPDIVNSKISKISRVFINPYHSKPAPGVLEAIREADCICFAPGSLYTSIIPNLLIKGVAKEIKESKAFKVYVSNLMTEPGQTYNYTLSDHIEAINSHGGGNIIDYCIYDTSEIIPEYIRKYNMEGYELVEQDIQKVKNMGVKVIQRDISGVDGEFIRHSPKETARAIIELVCEDLKFNNKQNDFKYLSVNDRLKMDRKLNKKKKNKSINKKKDKKELKRKSKFYSKYQERIESIHESDMKLKEKEKLYEIDKLNRIQEKLKKKNIKETAKKDINKELKAREVKVKDSKEKSSVAVSNKRKTSKKIETESNKKTSKINELNDLEKKKFIDTINKLRK